MMASQAQMDRVIGRALFSEEFRRALLEDPERAVRKLRIRLDPNQAARIRSLDPQALDQLAEDFGRATGTDLPRQGLSFW